MRIMPIQKPDIESNARTVTTVPRAQAAHVQDGSR